jgi:hypothetical protein
MTWRLALRALATRPVRTAVLACGFGFGIAVMAALLGVGEVILEQARSPALSGGGDLVMSAADGPVPSARFVLSRVLGNPRFVSRIRAASPSRAASLYLVDGRGVVAVDARGVIPSLDRALGDPEVSSIAAWNDGPQDQAWLSPSFSDVLRAMDRFHPIPDVASRAESWAEWLYFNGRAGSAKFYLTFFVGPRRGTDRRAAGVRLQLDRDGHVETFSDEAEVAEATLLTAAPDLTFGKNRVRLVGTTYRISLCLPRDGSRFSRDGAAAVGEITLDGSEARSLPPFTLHGGHGWLSGYTVPVPSGKLDGMLHVRDDAVDFANGSGYHDHNWGFWGGVSWQWGQVAGDDLSLVYGRIRPPADAADPERIPCVLIVTSLGGDVTLSRDVTIEEIGRTPDGAPQRIALKAKDGAVDLDISLDTMSAIRTRVGGGPFGARPSETDFFQLRVRAHVIGRVGERHVDFTSMGSAETFCGTRDMTSAIPALPPHS